MGNFMNNISKLKKKIPAYSKKCTEDARIGLNFFFETFIFSYMWVKHLLANIEKNGKPFNI